MSARRKSLRKPKLALVLDPRFPGGTSSAVAREITAVSNDFDLSICAIATRMFRGREINPTLMAAAADQNVEIIWDMPVVGADIVVLHNPSCLKFNDRLDLKIICGQAYIVTHENFLRPNGAPGFDIEKCLRIISKSLICPTVRLAPVSRYNRLGVGRWIEQNNADWRVAEFDWFNICDFEMIAPVADPKDRRGRVSRPGLEKFPPLSTMIQQFPAHAQTCRILGGDTLLLDREFIPDHWEVLEFGAAPVDTFLQGIDFFVYYTHPNWRESFGRVIAEAIAAGKVVITDPATADSFGSAVIASDGTDIDRIIQHFVRNPAKYCEFVRRAQKLLTKFGSAAFRKQLQAQLVAARDVQDALL